MSNPTREQWEQIKRIFDQALDQNRSKRADYVHRLCQGDSELESEVNRLLAANDSADSFLDLPPTITLGYFAGESSHRSLTPEEIVLGRFKILRFLNSGGMGEVYEAWDAELREKIALKTIRPEIAADRAMIERFKMEVKQARGVSHPNICRVYDLFSYDQSPDRRIWFLTMELLEGHTLLEQVRKQGSIEPKEAIHLIEQMVAGLAAAHRRGLVHRDFKSGNVMLVHAGQSHPRAVITDFGLALSLSAAAHSSERGALIEGTPDYMAPEQMRGDSVGVAADQYALGVVICEMLTGKRPQRLHSNENGATLLLPAVHNLPPRWEAVIRRCLEISPQNRFRDLDELLWELNSSNRWKILAGKVVAIVGFAVVVTAALELTLFKSGPDRSRLEHLVQLTPSTDFSGNPSISRDGKTVAYMSDRAESGHLSIWMQHVTGGMPIRLTADPAEDVDPSISPDGNSVVFRSSRNGGGIYRTGPAPKQDQLLVAGGRDPRYSPDGRTVVYWLGDEDETSPSGRLELLSLEGGGAAPTPLAKGFIDARMPVWSSDGQYVLFQGCRTNERPMPQCTEWWVTNLSGSIIRNTGSVALLGKHQITPINAVSGWYGDVIVFCGLHLGATGIWKVKLSEDTLLASGLPTQLTSADETRAYPSASLADDHTIAISQMNGAVHIWRLDGVHDHKLPTIVRVTQDAARDSTPYISNDGRWLVFSRNVEGRHDIWIKNLSTGTESQLVTSAAAKFTPLIDNSGELVVFEVRDQDTATIWWKSLGQPERMLCSRCSHPTGWFDGYHEVFYRTGLPSKINLGTIGTQESKVILSKDKQSLDDASWSPTNGYLLFTAISEGRNRQVFAVRFPKSTAAATGAWIQITNESVWSDKPRWSSDGKYVYYLSGRDGYPCLWGQRFDPALGKPVNNPFVVKHFHNTRLSPETLPTANLELSVFDDVIVLNLGEVSESIWTGILRQ